MRISGGDWKQATRPCVYLVDRNGSKLYVGRSSYGLSRVYGYKHPVLSNLELDDTIEVTFFDNEQDAANEERRLFEQYQPILNKVLPSGKVGKHRA